jgi:DNA-binding protein HU-beta
MKMNKTQLVNEIADRAGIYGAQAERALNAFIEVVGEELGKGEKIQVVGFGTFEVSERAAKTGRNPQTGEEIQISACKVPKFRPGKALKDRANS